MKLNLKYSLFFLIILIFSCKEEKDSAVKSDTEKNELRENPHQFDLKKEKDTIFYQWVHFYKDLDPNFDVKNFKKLSTRDLDLMEGTVSGSFDQDFDPIYKDLLIYSPDKEKYLDLDSYHWQMDENQQLQFSPDQEVNLVNLPEKTVQRIVFRGPSNTVEDAFWKGNNQIVLLEGTYDKVPMISLVNLDKEEITTYIYPDTLAARSNYYQKRIENKIEIKNQIQ